MSSPLPTRRPSQLPPTHPTQTLPNRRASSYNVPSPSSGVGGATPGTPRARIASSESGQPRKPSTIGPVAGAGATPGSIGMNRRVSTAEVDKRRARREQFREFYGITKEEGENDIPSATIGVSGVAGPSKISRRVSRIEKGNGGNDEGEELVMKRGEGNPLDIDSTSFDATAYYEDLIQNSSLAELMKRASTLSADIGNLQSSRHALVYHHHHQLFSAGDTISILNSRTPQLLSIVTSLQDSFSSISQLADSVALPDEPNISPRDPSSVGVSLGREEMNVQKGMERFRLLMIAEASGEELRGCYEKFKLDLEALREKDKEWEMIYQECQRALERIPNTAEDPAVGSKAT